MKDDSIAANLARNIGVNGFRRQDEGLCARKGLRRGA